MVYATPKENLIVLNEELKKMPAETPGIRLQALVQASATQANQIDPSPPVKRGRDRRHTQTATQAGHVATTARTRVKGSAPATRGTPTTAAPESVAATTTGSTEPEPSQQA
jgi:hypothetical protein